jgi:UPF0755 protein
VRHLAALLALLVPVGAAAFAWKATWRVERWLASPPSRGASLPVVVEIPRGRGASAIASDLERAGLVDDARLLRAYVLATRQAGKLQAGEYLFEEPLSPLELVDVIVSGRVRLHAYTVPEGLDLRETAQHLAGVGAWSPDDLVAAFRDVALLADLDPSADPASGLEGYLFPETYRLPKGATAQDVARAMAAGFREAWAEVDGSQRAAVLGLSIRQVATIASLIEEETPLPSEHALVTERPLVSAVYHNRLRRGMRLECDPTVIYALKRDGVWPGGALLTAQLSHDSPYNTYVRSGLPPGPICSFGKEALLAALEPAVTDYVYFVATGEGGHRFASTESEHRRNVLLYRRWQRSNGSR